MRMPALKKVEKPGRTWAVTNLARRIAAPRVRFPAPAAAILDQSAVLAPENFLKILVAYFALSDRFPRS